ncbi:hypothetical protein [Novosphingobium sp.]|uniref:hypothetical protein n=1 Tax=Novosphingobium sp. TaxID=1874826 RepID=UPI001EBBD18C|nr:hypothetical protein [Novosphingobium sp.]MBK9009920.1 hypothetical protein [Novosphingobium sp.]
MTGSLGEINGYRGLSPSGWLSTAPAIAILPETFADLELTQKQVSHGQAIIRRYRRSTSASGCGWTARLSMRDNHQPASGARLSAAREIADRRI